MQTRPDGSTLLEAISAFLLNDVAPKLEADKAVVFRVMIAANLANLLAAELRTEDDRFEQEAARLKGLFPDKGALPELASPRRDERLAALSALEAALVNRLREQGPDDASLAHLWETARQTLAVTNPRFDLSENV